MPINKGYIHAERSASGDEQMTPKYAIMPLLKYIPKDKIIWCPFDTLESEFVKIFQKEGYKVIFSHIKDGIDFFEYHPEEKYDIIISNPPYSKKDKILKRLNELNKPFAMLMPLPTLQGQKRFNDIKDCQALIFDKRIKYIKDGKEQPTPAFASIYICKDFLPKDLIFEELIIN